MSKLYIAIKTAMFEYEGKRVLVRKGHTTIEEGHPILVAYPDLFKELVPDWSASSSPSKAPDVLPGTVQKVEDASADPDRPRRRGRPKTSDVKGHNVAAGHASVSQPTVVFGDPPEE